MAAFRVPLHFSPLDYLWPSVQFSHSVVSDSLRPHGLQHTKLLCPSPTPRACSNSCPWSWWCHPTTSSSVFPFFSCLQSFPASGSFPISQFFASSGQSIGASASASVLPMNIHDRFPLQLNYKVWSPYCPGDSQKSSPTPQFKSINSSSAFSFFVVQLSHPYITAYFWQDLSRSKLYLKWPNICI